MYSTRLWFILYLVKIVCCSTSSVQYLKQPVGAMTYMKSMPIKTRIPCATACMNERGCNGFWHENENCDLFSDVFNGTENELYFDTSKEFKQPVGFLTIFDTDGTAFAYDFSNAPMDTPPARPENLQFPDYLCYVMIDKGVLFFQLLELPNYPMFYDFTDQEPILIDSGPYVTYVNHYDGACTMGPHDRLVLAGGKDTKEMELFKDGAWRNLKTIFSGPLLWSCLTFMEGNLDEFYIIAGYDKTSGSYVKDVWGYTISDTVDTDVYWQETQTMYGGYGAACAGYVTSQGKKVFKL